ncbi:hypothetical protein CCP3SC15_3050003 [Gammaproteobacteria bacterium]
MINGRNLSLPKGIVESRVYLAHIQTESSKSVAVNGERGLNAAFLLNGVDIGKLRQHLQGRPDPRLPGM